MNGELLNLMQEEISVCEKKINHVNSEIRSKQKELFNLRKELNEKKKGKSLFLGEKIIKKPKKKPQKIEEKKENV